MFVPVVDKNQKPLMPTIPSRARRWIKSGKATPFWKKGIFCVRLNVEPSDEQTQPMAIGIDPGSKKEALTVKSTSHTYFNIQADAVTWVSEAIKTRRDMRHGRRQRKTPHRQPRYNRAIGGLPPSIKARWQWKLNLCRWLAKMLPITTFVVEDISASTHHGRHWNRSFSPLQIGKTFFYKELEELGKLETRRGWETGKLRVEFGLKKSSDKLSNKFEAHCIDSWVLANSWTGGHTSPDNTAMVYIAPIRFHRRQLHYLQPGKGGVRKSYGSTRSLGFKRGSWVKHPKWGICYVGGTSLGRISLHEMKTGKRITQHAHSEDCMFLTYSSWRAYS